MYFYCHFMMPFVVFFIHFFASFWGVCNAFFTRGFVFKLFSRGAIFFPNVLSWLGLLMLPL